MSDESITDGQHFKISPFDQLVYNHLKTIPKGKITTYKNIAVAIHKPKAYRAVGSALRRNPYAPHIPCHRVVASSYKLGGYQGQTNPTSSQMQRKVHLLLQEGIKLSLDQSIIISDNIYRQQITI